MLVRASYASGCAGGEADLIGGFNVRRCVRDGADGLGCGEWCTAGLSEVVGWAGAWRACCRRRVTYPYLCRLYVQQCSATARIGLCSSKHARTYCTAHIL